MQFRNLIAPMFACALLAACSSNSNSDEPAVTPAPEQALIANFAPALGVIPFPNNLLFSGTTDLTVNIPVAAPTDYGDPAVAINTLDGFSTVAPWSTTFSAPLDPDSLIGGDTVHVFEVTLASPAGAVTGVVRELESPAEYVLVVALSDTTKKTLAVVPTQPLKPRTSYMVVITGGVASSDGVATASKTYTLAKGASPLCVNGQSTIEGDENNDGCKLEPLRQLVNAQEAAAAAAGVDRANIALSWVSTTQSTAAVLQYLTAKVLAGGPAPVQVAPTGMTLGDLGLGLAPIADIYIGTISLPYYLGIPSAQNPLPPLTEFWHAAPGAYIPAVSDAGLDPTSTNITAYNPFPVPTGTVTVPLLLTVPNAASQHSRPATGWPIVIFQHGITRNRTDMLAIAQTMSAQGFAVIAIDIPLHGVDASSPFYIESTPFGAIADERTFGLDVINNQTGAPGPDGVADPSGSHFINLSSLLTSRDNLRQAATDLVQLAHAIPSMSFDGDAMADFDAGQIRFVGQSLGAIVGTVFTAIDPTVNVALLNVPGGGIAGLIDGSASIGPQIHAGLEQAGLIQGTPEYAAFFVAAQTVIDSADPINFALFSAGESLLLQEIVGTEGISPPDQVVPNSVPGAPLSGTEPLIAALQLEPIDETTQSADGVRVVTRFTSGVHGSLLDPAPAPLVTAEMQGEMASLMVSAGTVVQVNNPIVLQPVPLPEDDDTGDGD